MYFSRVFWQSTAERAIKTFIQTVIAAGVIGVTPLLSINWEDLLLTGAGAALLSVLMSLAGSQVGTSGDPSLVAPLEVGSEPPSARGSEVVDPDELEEGDVDDVPEDLVETSDEVRADMEAEADANAEVDVTPPSEDYAPRH